MLIAGAGLAAVVIASTGWMAWSLISTSRHPGARVRALPTQSVISEPVSSIPDGATLPPAPDSPAEAAAMPPITPVKPAPDGPVEVAVMPPITPVIPLSSEHPASAASPPAGEGVAQPARVKQPPGVPPVADRSLPAAVESASARPPKAARPAPRSGAARPESESPDPSAIIDWLIKAKGGPSEGP
jgi:hypothetical protein